MSQAEAEETTSGDYKYFEYKVFKAVGYDRSMSWKAGTGYVRLGTTTLDDLRKTDEDKEDVLAPAFTNVLVADTNFKLVRKDTVAPKT